MAISTTKDLIKSALKLIGALDPHEEPTAEEASDGLDVLNEMIATWNIERLTIYTITRSQQNIVAGKQTYTIGTGGIFNIARPDRIEHASIITSNGSLELMINIKTVTQWQEIPTKGTTSTLPNRLYYEPTFPLGIINLWPVPQESIPIILHLWQRHTRFVDLTTSLSFPDGYIRALRYNLAIELEPEYGMEASQRVQDLALESKGRIKSINIGPLDAQIDEALIGRGPYFDWRTGDPR